MNKQKVFLLLNISISSILIADVHQKEMLPINPGFHSPQSYPLKSTHRAVSPAQLFPEKFRKLVLESAPKRFKDLIEVHKDPTSLERIKSKRILLHGASGMGKTTMMQVLAQELGRPCIFIKAGLLGTEFQISAAQNLQKIVDEVDKPCVLGIDEIDVILKPAKGTNGDDVPKQIWEILDQCAKSPHIIIIGSTNSLKGVEEPVLTRFAGEEIEVPANNSIQVRSKIILNYLDGIVHECDEKFLAQIANKSKELSNREIEKMVNEALKIAHLRKSSPFLVTKNDFEEAFKIMQKSRENFGSEKRSLLKHTYYIGKEVAGWLSIGTGFASYFKQGEAVKKAVEVAPVITKKVVEIAPKIIPKIGTVSSVLAKHADFVAAAKIIKGLAANRVV